MFIKPSIYFSEKEIKQLLVIIIIKHIQRDVSAFACKRWYTESEEQSHITEATWIPVYNSKPIRNRYNHICGDNKVWVKLRCTFAPIPLAENLCQNFTALMNFIQNLSVPSLHPIVGLLPLHFNLKSSSFPFIYPGYNNTEQWHPLPVFSAKKLRSGPDTGV